MATEQAEGAVPAPMVGNLSPEQLEFAYTALRAEYNTTVRVVAVLVERLLVATGSVLITITDLALHESPDLDARRNEARQAVLLKTTR